MDSSDINLYGLLGNINDTIQNESSGITPTIYSILESINEINISTSIIDDYIKNIGKFSEDTSEQHKLKNELLEYKSDLLKIKAELQNSYKDAKEDLITLKDVKSLTEKAIQLNTGDIF